MQNVMVTGGAGFIGSNFVRYLLARQPRSTIVNLDSLTYAGTMENLRDLDADTRHIFMHGDICDRQLVDDTLRRHRVDTIVHFAAESHVDRSIIGPEPFVRTNVVGTFTLLEAARRYWLVDRQTAGVDNRFHHVSTDEVYGALGPSDPPFAETTPYAPSSPYAASKAASDHLVRAYGHTYGLPATISNCSNNYGPHQFPEKLVPLVILNALAGKPLPIYGDGRQVRDWLYVGDHCEAIELVLANGGPGETYNIGGGNEPTNLSLVQTICDLLDELKPGAASYRRQIQFVADRPGHDRRYAMDSSKIGRELGWSPRHSLVTGLRSTVEWYLEHPDWAASIQQQAGYRTWLDQNYEQRENPA